VVALINGVFPAINKMSGSMTSVSDASNDRMKTEIRIIWESASQTDNTLNVYVKNTGDRKITDAYIAMTDIYYGGEASMNKCNHVGGVNPTWTYSIADGNGDSGWDPGETLDICVTTDDHDFKAGSQRVKILLYNGVSDEDTFAL
jgi:archaellum component FlaG (FlaF/FlaG flagellin family)